MNLLAPFKIDRNSWLFAGRGEGAVASEVVKWWEARRIPYNLIVGATGLITCAACLIISVIAQAVIGEPLGLPDPPIIAVITIVAYAIMANVCFTAGWLAELLVQKIRPDYRGRFAPALFFRGLLFSVLLTLSPVVLIGGSLILRLLSH